VESVIVWKSAIPARFAVKNNVLPPKPNFSNRLRTLRAAKGYATARDFSRALQIEEARYTRWERGETEPDISNILRICRVLDIDPNELLLPHISEKRTVQLDN
jgi:transcriptional regulator with XRE-family HTH domain